MTDLHKPEAAVRERYGSGAQACEEALCCPTSFDPRYLKVLPEEIIERDYGCGNPTPYVQEGDVVLDLGSGAGKACWIASQMVGPNGQVIGIDMTPEMLALTRRHHRQIAERIGYDNVSFRRGLIQDLALDLDLLDQELQRSPISGSDAWLAMREHADELRRSQPMIADASIDVVLSNCVLNLVRPQDKRRLFEELYRVTKVGGRIAIADIVCDEDVPQEMQNDPELWSGCISGAFREDLLLRAFEDAGFHGIAIEKRDEEPWRTVNGIEFRAMTVLAFKGKAGECLERNQAVIYKGPFSRVHDDDGHVYHRGERMAVCDKTYRLLQQPPYAGTFVPVPPREEIPLDRAGSFGCNGATRRPARVTKGADYDATSEADGSSCC